MGINSGTVTNCYATGNTSGSGGIGGLVGDNAGTVTCCFSTGTTRGNSWYVGGLVGSNSGGTVVNCFATGNTSGTSWYLGGLVGGNLGTVTNSHYNINVSLINNGHYITVGGIFEYQYYDWYSNGLSLKISDYNRSFVLNGNYYEINSLQGLMDLLGFVDNNNYRFRLAADIDVSTAPGFYIPDFSSKEFDGGGHSISHVWINQSFNDNLGFFGLIRKGSSVANLKLIDIRINGWEYVGGLVGSNYGTVSNCSAIGSTSGNYLVGGLVGWNVRGTVTDCSTIGRTMGSDNVGGLVGWNEYGFVTNCFVTGNTSGIDNIGGLVGYNNGGNLTNGSLIRSTSGIDNVGGLVGHYYQGSVINCWTSGNISGIRAVGGLVGRNNEGSVMDSYSMVKVTRLSGTNTHFGAFVGNNKRGKVLRCYSNGSVIYSGAADPTDNGFAGSVDTAGDYEMSANFWDMKTSGQTSTAGEATGLDTREMQKKFTFVNASWDFDNMWNMIENVTYPFLTWQDEDHPFADAGPDRIVHLGSIGMVDVIFDGSNSTDDYGIFNYTWSFDYHNYEVVLFGEKVEFTFSIMDTFVVTLKVSDASGNWDTDVVKVTVLDISLPVANAGPDQVVDEGTLVTFDGNASFDNVGIISWTWTFNDGIEDITLYGPNPSQTFKVPGIYSVKLNVTDAAGNWATDTMTVTVNDITPPLANAGPDRTVNEGNEVMFNGSGSHDNVGIVNWTWTFNDGMDNNTIFGPTPSHIFTVNGIYTVTLKVTDAVGHWATDTMTVTVKDIMKPIADAGSDQIIDEGTLVSFNGSDSNDNVGIINFTWSFIDVLQITLYGSQAKYQFNNLGIFIVTLNVTDAAGNWATATMTVTVRDITSPFAKAGSDQIVDEGTTVMFVGIGSYDNVGIVNYTWTFVDGILITLYGFQAEYQFNTDFREGFESHN